MLIPGISKRVAVISKTCNFRKTSHANAGCPATLLTMITLKIKYTATAEFYVYLKDLRRQQSIAARSIFKKLQLGWKQKDIKDYIKTLSNIEEMDSWWTQSVNVQAQTLFAKVGKNKVIFGSKGNLQDYNKKLISKAQFKDKRLYPLVSIGECNQFGNRKFRLENNILKFQPKKGIKFDLQIQPQLRDRLEQFQWIEDQTKEKRLPLTVYLDEEYIHLTFKPKQKEPTKQIENRVFAIDSNPNSIGWSVCDIINETPVVVDSGIIELTELNKQSTNKRHHEIYEICKFLVNMAVHYQCSKFAVEDLNISPKDNKKGRCFNRTVNNVWIRQKLFENLKKRCFINNISFVEVNPAFTSIIGGTIHRNYPDPISPTLEIARRAFFKYQKGKFYPKVPNKEALNEHWKQTLEQSFESWRDVADWLKNSKYRYRVSVDSFESKVFRFKSKRSTVMGRSCYI